MQRGSVGSLSQSPSSPLGSLPPPFVPQHIQQQEKQEQQLQMVRYTTPLLNLELIDFSPITIRYKKQPAANKPEIYLELINYQDKI